MVESMNRADGVNIFTVGGKEKTHKMMLRSNDKQGEPPIQSSDSDEQEEDGAVSGVGPYAIARSWLEKCLKAERNCHLSADDKTRKPQLAAQFDTPLKTQNESQRNSSCEAWKQKEGDSVARQGKGVMDPREKIFPSSEIIYHQKGYPLLL